MAIFESNIVGTGNNQFWYVGINLFWRLLSAVEQVASWRLFCLKTTTKYVRRLLFGQTETRLKIWMTASCLKPSALHYQGGRLFSSWNFIEDIWDSCIILGVWAGMGIFFTCRKHLITWWLYSILLPIWLELDSHTTNWSGSLNQLSSEALRWLNIPQSSNYQCFYCH